MKYPILISSALFVLFPLFAFAQLTTASATNDYFISLTPADPIPGQLVTAEVTSHFADLKGYSVAWTLGSKKVGTGLSTQFNAPPVGEAATLAADITDKEGVSFYAETEIRPLELQLLTEPLSLVPPLYRGKPLGSPGTSITAHAIARVFDEKGLQIPESELAYTWTLNGKLLTLQSGAGKKILSIPSTGYTKTTEIQVTVESTDGAHASRSTTVTLKDPQTILYENSPLFGVMYYAPFQPTNLVDRSEVRLTAFPYFAGVNRLKTQRLEFAWTVNNTPVQANSNTPEIVLGAKSGQGSAAVKVSLSDSINYLLQSQGAWDFTFSTLGGN